MSDTDIHLLTASNRTKCGIDIDGLFRTPRITSLREDVTCRECDPDAVQRLQFKPGSLDALLYDAFMSGYDLPEDDIEPDKAFDRWRLSLLGDEG